MELSKIDLTELIPQLEDRRKKMQLTYQNVADACNVSQRTIMRIFKQETSPTFDLLQRVISLLEMEDSHAPIAPEAPSTDAYIQYLRDCIDFEREDKRIRLDKQEARHNRQRNEQRRVIIVVVGICGILVIFICAVLIYDLTHPDLGWFQGYAAAKDALTSAVMAVRNWWDSIWM